MTIKAITNYRAEMWKQPLESTCPECGGAGFVRVGDVAVTHPRFGKIEPCHVCSLEARATYLVKHCGLTNAELQLRLTHLTPGKWPNQEPEVRQTWQNQRREAVKALSTALAGRTGFYTFWGDFGSGKSMALKIAANEMRLKLVESFYAPLAFLLDHLRSLYGQQEQSSHFWQRLLDVPVLCIDEVTRFNETPWAREKLFMLVDTRYRRLRSHLTLFAANDNPHHVLSPTEDVGYLFSRMRSGCLLELRGDMRLSVSSNGSNGR